MAKHIGHQIHHVLGGSMTAPSQKRQGSCPLDKLDRGARTRPQADVTGTTLQPMLSREARGRHKCHGVLHQGRLADFVVAPTFPSSDTTQGFNPLLAASLPASARAALVGRIEDHETESFQKSVAPRMSQLGQAIDSLGDLKPGDTIDLDWLPGRGTQLSRNGKVIGTAVPGEDLYGAVMRIFVGDHPIDRRMKKGL